MRNALILFAMIASPVFSNEADKDYLTAFLEDSLSDAGREVTITGFVGALSSQATIKTMTIADDGGVWLTLDEVVLDWSQSSLLSGELVVNELSAKALTVVRIPQSDATALPSPEAAGFSLPELPVSVTIGRIAIDRIELAPELLGQPVAGSLQASLSLAEGAGRAQLDLSRTDNGPTGLIRLDAAYDNATGLLDLALEAREGAGGIVVSTLGIPDHPSSDFRLSGSGPVTAFSAEISLATNGIERLSGKATLDGQAEDGIRLQAELAGNLAPLFLPDYVPFLGSRLELSLDARRAASGAVAVDHLHLSAQSLSLDGTASIAADGLPERISLNGVMASPDGQPLLLPFGDMSTRIDRAGFRINTIDDAGLVWTADLDIAGLDRSDLDVGNLTLSGSGRIGRTPTGNSLGGTFEFSATGLSPSDPALADALGSDLSGGFKLHYHESGDALQISNLELAGKGLNARGQVEIEGLGSAFSTSGQMTLGIEDLSRLAGLVGQPLGGAADMSIKGSASLLSGEVDGRLDLSAQDLRVGVAQLDRLLAGRSTASLSLRRDETGTRIRDLELTAGAVSATLSGTLSSAMKDIQGQLSVSDLSALDPAYAGAAAFDIRVTGDQDTTGIEVSGTANGLSVGNPSADSILAGENRLGAVLALSQDHIGLESLILSSSQLDLSVKGTFTRGRQELSIQGKLADLGLLVADMAGPLTVSGTVVDDGTAFAVDLSGRGPGQIDAKVTGGLSHDLGTADLRIIGSGQAGLANIFIAPRVVEGPSRFDLRLTGPLDVSSLSGSVSLAKGRLSDPGLGSALEGIAAQASLKGGKALVSATAGLSTGGNLRIEGSVGLSAPFGSDLTLDLDRVRFFDPKLYETVLGGALAIKGPLTGGATISGELSLSETNLRVPESGIDAAGLLYEVTNLGEPADVRATRVRAGLLDGSGEPRHAAGQPFRLNLTLSAPSRIFLRGRGIDAELGGVLRLGGTTDAVVPSGEFGLIRGRLDILGKRLVLDRANLMLEGSFVPLLEISASTENDGIQSFVTIEGPADNPEVAFSSIPELPQEEVLAQLLFGRSLESISALQAAQLAQAVAVLAGRGGEGVIGRLRKSFGLDDLDVETGEDGSAALKAGKYLSENIYTEVEIDQEGSSRINLNLDLRPGVTVKGQVGADGDTGIGIFIEKDY